MYSENSCGKMSLKYSGSCTYCGHGKVNISYSIIFYKMLSLDYKDIIRIVWPCVPAGMNEVTFLQPEHDNMEYWIRMDQGVFIVVHLIMCDTI